MNREIKFRALSPYGVWLYGMPTYDFEYVFNADNLDSPDSYEVIPDTVGQYIGVKDGNGIDIYEGDIFDVSTPRGKHRKVVKYRDNRASFSIADIKMLKHEGWMDVWETPSSSWWDMFKEHIEVIGNIHENRNLIE